MIRRRLTVRRVDPWSALKLGLFLNIAAGLVLLLTGAIVWSVIRRLQVIERSCEQLQNIFGLEECALSGATVARNGFFLVVLWVIVLTAVMVFSAFLYNLVADLTGGVEVTAVDHTAGAGRSAGGGVEVAPELHPTSPQMVDLTGRRPVGRAMPPDAVDRRLREPSKLKQAAKVAATKVQEVSKTAGAVLTDATESPAMDRLRRTQAGNDAVDPDEVAKARSWRPRVPTEDATAAMDAVGARRGPPTPRQRQAASRDGDGGPEPSPAGDTSSRESSTTTLHKDATELSFGTRRKPDQGDTAEG